MGSKGFSLLELSIVITIIGLVAGGIIVGQDLIRSAELKSLAGDLLQYETATNAFRLKYYGLPGDLRNATRYWGAADPTPATCKTTASTGLETCDGDGNKAISPYAGGSFENYRYWQHLANAGLIGGQFTGISGPGWETHTLPGVNAPEGRVPGQVIAVAYWGAVSGNADHFDGFYGNHFWVTGMESALPLTPQETLQIDQKLDDSRPATGIVRSLKSTSPLAPGCTTSDDAAAAYNLARDERLCLFLFMLED